MSYPVRNTLIIAAVWAFFLGLGYYYVFGVQRAAEKNWLQRWRSSKTG